MSLFKFVEQRNKVIAAYFGSGDPTAWRMHLYLTAPTTDGGGVEVSTGGYAPVTIPNNPTNFPAPVNGSTKLATDTDFGSPTDDLLIVGIGFINDDDDEPGYYGDLGAPYTHVSGDPLVIPANTVTIRET